MDEKLIKVCSVQLKLKQCKTWSSFFNYLRDEVFSKLESDVDLVVFPENINLCLLFAQDNDVDSYSTRSIFEKFIDGFLSLLDLSFLLKIQNIKFQKSIIVSVFQVFAKKYNVNIITGSFYELTNDGIFNTIYAINRFGEILGSSVKKDLVGIEKAFKIKSKAENKVINFDFAKVGLCICFDLNDKDYCSKFDCDILVAPSNGYRPIPNYPFDEKKETPQIEIAQDNNICVIRPYCAGWMFPLYFSGRTMIVDKIGKIYKTKSKDKTELLISNINI